MNEQIDDTVPPMVTPFRDDRRYLIETASAHGRAVCGSAGEGHTLSTEEKRPMTAAIVEEASGRVPVITRIITNSTATVIKRVKRLKPLGVARRAVGSIAAILTAAVTLCVGLWNGAQSADEARSPNLQEKSLRIWNTILADNLPANTHACMELQEQDEGFPHPPMPPSSDAQRWPIHKALTAAVRSDLEEFARNPDGRDFCRSPLRPAV